MRYQANGKRLVITRKEAEEITAGGIVLPDSAKDAKLSEGYIESVGRACDAEYWEEGMHVVFAQFAGQEVKVEGEIYLVIPEEDVLVYDCGAE